MSCPCGFTNRRDRCRLFTTDPKGTQGYVSYDKGGGLNHFEERSWSSPCHFILVFTVFFLRQFFSEQWVSRFIFFCVCFPFSFVLFFRLFAPLLPFIFFSLSPPLVFFSFYFEFTGRASGYRCRDPPGISPYTGGRRLTALKVLTCRAESQAKCLRCFLASA